MAKVQSQREHIIITENKMNSSQRYTVDFYNYELMLPDGRVNKLAKSEVLIIEYFIMNKGTYINSKTLVEVGWPKKVVGTNSLSVAISNIRRQFERKDIISYSKNMGYKINEELDLELVKDHESINDKPIDIELKSKILVTDIDKSFFSKVMNTGFLLVLLLMIIDSLSLALFFKVI